MIEYSILWPSKIPCRQKCNTQQKGNGTVDILPVEEAIRCSAKLWLCLVVILNLSWSPPRIRSCISNFQHAREAHAISCNWSNNHTRRYLTAHALNISEFHSILAVARLKRASVGENGGLVGGPVCRVQKASFPRDTVSKTSPKIHQDSRESKEA